MIENCVSCVEDEAKQVFADLLVEELRGTKCIIGRLKSNADGRQVQDKYKEVLLHMVSLC